MKELIINLTVLALFFGPFIIFALEYKKRKTERYQEIARELNWIIIDDKRFFYNDIELNYNWATYGEGNRYLKTTIRFNNNEGFAFKISKRGTFSKLFGINKGILENNYEMNVEMLNRTYGFLESKTFDRIAQLFAFHRIGSAKAYGKSFDIIVEIGLPEDFETFEILLQELSNKRLNHRPRIVNSDNKIKYSNK